MADDEKPKKKKHRLIRIIGSILSLAVLTYIAIALITGRTIDVSWIPDLFSSREPVIMADEYSFDVGRDRVFADLGGPVAAAGSLGVQVLDTGGSETLRDQFRMSCPAIKAAGGRAIAFDIGGTAVSVFNGTQVIASIQTDTAVVSASINRNGWFCICTQGDGGFKGVTKVYNSKGKPVYGVSLASGYILSAVLSSDNSSLAVLNLADDCSRITFYNDLSLETADNVFDLPGILIVDIWYPPAGDLVAVSAESLITVNSNGKSSELYSFSGRRLGAYTLDNDFYAVYLFDYGLGYSGRLVTLDPKGQVLGEVPATREIISMSSGDGNLALLCSDGFSLYSAELEERPAAGRVSLSGANRILALKGGAALATGEHLAVSLKTAEIND